MVSTIFKWIIRGCRFGLSKRSRRCCQLTNVRARMVAITQLGIKCIKGIGQEL